MKPSLKQTIRNDVIECIQYTHEAARVNVRDTANCATVARFAFAIHSSIRLTVLIPTVETIQHNLLKNE